MRDIYEKFLKRVQKENNIKIYGAGKFAKTLCTLFDRNNIKVKAFIVTNNKLNPSSLLGRPVFTLDNLSDDEKTNIVVGFERKEAIKEVMDFLLNECVSNIIMVPPEVVNDIYCNFIIDEVSVKSFCSQILEEKSVVAYVNDMEGENIVYYLRKQGINIKKVYTDLKELNSYKDFQMQPYEEINENDKDTAVILTMGSVEWQRVFITKLRKSGFEKIILISDELLKIMKTESCRLLWETGNFQLLDNVNVEKQHCIIQCKRKEIVYRWRLAQWDFHTYKKDSIEMIKSGSILNEYERYYPNCFFLPYTECSLNQISTEKNLNIEVYMAKFHKDKKVDQVLLPEWIIPIQVGKALTNTRIENICDDTGDNISKKNVDYSEGTALYWMWKNTSGQDYIGLFHYRRHMAMGADSLSKLVQYDVLLTVPTYVAQTVKGFFCEYCIWKYDWKLMMNYIKEYDKSYYETALKYENLHSYFACNIFIMKRKYFDEMCQFIFGVLEKVSEYYNRIQIIRKDRYLGYLVENLLSIYIMHNAKRFKIAYTDMKFYIPIDEIK